LLKQPQNAPLPVYKQILILFAGLNGFLEELDTLAEVSSYEQQLYSFVDSPNMLPFMPYLETISEERDFNLDDNPIITILDHFTDYLYKKK